MNKQQQFESLLLKMIKTCRNCPHPGLTVAQKQTTVFSLHQPFNWVSPEAITTSMMSFPDERKFGWTAISEPIITSLRFIPSAQPQDNFHHSFLFSCSCSDCSVSVAEMHLHDLACFVQTQLPLTAAVCDRSLDSVQFTVEVKEYLGSTSLSVHQAVVWDLPSKFKESDEFFLCFWCLQLCSLCLMQTAFKRYVHSFSEVSLLCSLCHHSCVHTDMIPSWNDDNKSDWEKDCCPRSVQKKPH